MGDKTIITHLLGPQSCAVKQLPSCPHPLDQLSLPSPAVEADQHPSALQSLLCCTCHPAASLHPAASPQPQHPCTPQHPYTLAWAVQQCRSPLRCMRWRGGNAVAWRTPLIPRQSRGCSLPEQGSLESSPWPPCLGQVVTNRVRSLNASLCSGIWHQSIFITVMACLEVINGWRKTNFLLILLWHICSHQSDTLNIYEVCHFSNIRSPSSL